MRVGTEGYGGCMDTVPRPTRPTLPTGSKGLAGLSGLFTSKCTGESWQRIKIPGPWSEFCLRVRKDWGAGGFLKLQLGPFHQA